MTSILYHGEPNGPSLTVLAAAFEKQVDLALERIDLVAGDRHGVRVPHAMEIDQSIEGEGPVLVVDGTAMADSVFIACYLDDVGTGPALRPTDPYARWQMMAWCRYVVERLAPAASYLGLHAAPPAVIPQGIASVQRDTRVPVANAVIVTDDDDQAIARMHAKGADAARAVIEMTNLLRQLDRFARSDSQ